VLWTFVAESGLFDRCFARRETGTNRHGRRSVLSLWKALLFVAALAFVAGRPALAVASKIILGENYTATW
jgi:hypothetical protein